MDGFFKAHVERINKLEKKQEEKAFQSKVEAPNSRDHKKALTRIGWGRGAFRGNSRGQDRGKGFEQIHFNRQRCNRINKQCHNYKMYEHA